METVHRAVNVYSNKPDVYMSHDADNLKVGHPRNDIFYDADKKAGAACCATPVVYLLLILFCTNAFL